MKWYDYSQAPSAVSRSVCRVRYVCALAKFECICTLLSPDDAGQTSSTVVNVCVFTLFTNIFSSRAHSLHVRVHSFAITAFERECKMLAHVAVWFYTRYSGFSSGIKRFYDVLKFKHQIYTPSDTELDNILLRDNNALECAHRHHSSDSKIVQWRWCCGTLAHRLLTRHNSIYSTQSSQNTWIFDWAMRVHKFDATGGHKKNPQAFAACGAVFYFRYFFGRCCSTTMEILLWSIGIANSKPFSWHAQRSHQNEERCKLVTCEPRNHFSACSDGLRTSKQAAMAFETTQKLPAQI